MQKNVTSPSSVDELCSAVNLEHSHSNSDPFSISKIDKSTPEIEMRSSIKSLIDNNFKDRSEVSNLKGSHFQISNRMLGSQVDLLEHGIIGLIIRRGDTNSE